ncbi:MAG TPA: NAD(P)/FAD-dependent oxidoreductase [Nocardioidaceae bacterium]|jgi:NADH dehydrogenase
MSKRTPHIVIAGGGYVGMYTALRLQRKLRRGEARVTVIDPRSTMTYQPFLPEAAAGNLEPRHVVVSLRRTLRHCNVLTARVASVDHAHQTLRVEPPESAAYDLHYDELVIAMGSVSRTLPIPGLAEHGMGFKQIEEAIALRNHVLDKLDLATTVVDPRERTAALTFVFVGGGYAGVEALAEIEDMVRYATRFYDTIQESDVRFVLVEALNRILPEVGEDMGRYTVDRLRKRGIEVRLNTRLESAVDRHIVLSDGEEFDADTLVWTAGVKATPVLLNTDLPLDDKGRLKARPDLTVEGADHVWAAGDNAAVPDLTQPGALTAPNAQHAVRQARVLGDNIVASLRGEPLKEYHHKYVGSVASLGLHKGVAQVYGVKLRGFPAWFMHRTYHLSRMPTLSKKARVVLDWTLALFFKRDVVALGALQHPRDDFDRANR